VSGAHESVSSCTGEWGSGAFATRDGRRYMAFLGTEGGSSGGGYVDGGVVGGVGGGNSDKRADMVLCDEGFEHKERFGDVWKVTGAFALVGDSRRGGGRGCGRRSGGGAPWEKEELWHVFDRA